MDHHPFYKLSHRIVSAWSDRLTRPLTAENIGPKILRICGATLDLRDYDRVVAVWCGRHPWEEFATQVEAVFGKEGIPLYETATSTRVAQLADVLHELGEDDAVVFLHGGSMYCRPDVLQALSALKHAGALPAEQDTVHKHLDEFSAPGLACLAQPADCLELCWSPAGIGCPCPSCPTTAREAREVLEFYNIPEMTGKPSFRLEQRNAENTRRVVCIDQDEMAQLFKDAVEEFGLTVHDGRGNEVLGAGEYPAYCSFAFLEDQSRLRSVLSQNPARTHLLLVWNEPTGRLRYVAALAGHAIPAQTVLSGFDQATWQGPGISAEAAGFLNEPFAIVAALF